LANKTGAVLSEIWKDSVVYMPVLMAVGHDPLKRHTNIAPFSISRREATPYSENKYFSEAPLPTDLHIKFREELEADVLKYSP
jgi:hypothetical protein